jgi:mannose-6-phosphate isomerase
MKEVHGPSSMIVTSDVVEMRAGGKECEVKEGWIFVIGQGVDVEYTAKAEAGTAVCRAYAE